MRACKQPRTGRDVYRPKGLRVQAIWNAAGPGAPWGVRLRGVRLRGMEASQKLNLVLSCHGPGTNSISTGTQFVPLRFLSSKNIYNPHQNLQKREKASVLDMALFEYFEDSAA